MLEPRYTAQEKLARGFPLSSNDFADLLKDPNSWVAKLYAESELSRILSFELYLQNIMAAQEVARLLAKEQEKMATSTIGERERVQQQYTGAQPLVTAAQIHASSASTANSISLAMDTLINVSHNISNQLNQLLHQQLGSSITLSSGLILEVPPPSDVAPIPSPLAVVEHNPVLSEQVQNNPGVAESLCAMAAAGTLNVIQAAGTVIDYNSEVLKKDMSVNEKNEIFQFIDEIFKNNMARPVPTPGNAKKAKTYKEEIYDNCLAILRLRNTQLGDNTINNTSANNNRRIASYIVMGPSTVSLTQSPAFYAENNTLANQYTIKFGDDSTNRAIKNVAHHLLNGITGNNPNVKVNVKIKGN
jgi:hypothetical protein